MKAWFSSKALARLKAERERAQRQAAREPIVDAQPITNEDGSASIWL